MKRRNFFSKIAKCLLGIGIVTALPTPEVETAPLETPQNVSTPELDWELNILRQTQNVSTPELLQERSERHEWETLHISENVNLTVLKEYP